MNEQTNALPAEVIRALLQVWEQPAPTFELRSYCMKCKCVRPMSDAMSIILPSGKSAVKGVCPVCGLKLMRSGGAI